MYMQSILWPPYFPNILYHTHFVLFIFWAGSNECRYLPTYNHPSTFSVLLVQNCVQNNTLSHIKRSFRSESSNVSQSSLNLTHTHYITCLNSPCLTVCSLTSFLICIFHTPTPPQRNTNDVSNVGGSVKAVKGEIIH